MATPLFVVAVLCGLTCVQAVSPGFRTEITEKGLDEGKDRPEMDEERYSMVEA